MQLPVVVPAKALEGGEVVPVGGELALAGGEAIGKVLDGRGGVMGTGREGKGRRQNGRLVSWTPSNPDALGGQSECPD